MDNEASLRLIPERRMIEVAFGGKRTPRNGGAVASSAPPMFT